MSAPKNSATAATKQRPSPAHSFVRDLSALRERAATSVAQQSGHRVNQSIDKILVDDAGYAACKLRQLCRAIHGPSITFESNAKTPRGGIHSSPRDRPSIEFVNPIFVVAACTADAPASPYLRQPWFLT